MYFEERLMKEVHACQVPSLRSRSKVSYTTAASRSTLAHASSTDRDQKLLVLTPCLGFTGVRETRYYTRSLASSGRLLSRRARTYVKSRGFNALIRPKLHIRVILLLAYGAGLHFAVYATVCGSYMIPWPRWLGARLDPASI